MINIVLGLAMIAVFLILTGTMLVAGRSQRVRDLIDGPKSGA